MAGPAGLIVKRAMNPTEQVLVWWPPTCWTVWPLVSGSEECEVDVLAGEHSATLVNVSAFMVRCWASAWAPRSRRCNGLRVYIELVACGECAFRAALKDRAPVSFAALLRRPVL